RSRGAAESDRLGGALPRGGVVAGPAPARAAPDLAAGPGRAGRLDHGRCGNPERRQRPAGHAAAAGAQGPDRPAAARASQPAAAAAADPALSTAECLAAVERARPDMSLRELRDLLEQLDRVAFASAHGTDIAALATMARRLAQEIGGRRSVP